MTTTLMNTRFIFSALLAVLLTAACSPAQQGETPAQGGNTPAPQGEAPADDAKKAKPAGPRVDEAQLKRLAKDHEIWIDLKQKFVVLGGEVCLREGPLEMFACTEGSKEHESVVSVKAPARFAHAALLAVGAKVGNVVQFSPAYKPASGTTIDIWVLWEDKAGNSRRARAQDWIMDFRNEKAMSYDWVFAGSGFSVDEETGQRYYHADGGDFICVSNFSTATLDLPVKSSQDTSDLLFAAYTEHIPPLKTPVRLVLMPRIEKKTDSSDTSSSTGK